MAREEVPVTLVATLDRGDALGNIEIQDKRTNETCHGKIIEIVEREGEVEAFKSILLRTDIGFDIRILCKHSK